MSRTYNVVVTGQLLTGFEIAQVKATVGQAFKLNQAQLDKVITGKPVIIQRGISKGKADKVRATLIRAGVQTVLKPGRVSAEAKPEARSAKTTADSTVKPAVTNINAKPSVTKTSFTRAATAKPTVAKVPVTASLNVATGKSRATKSVAKAAAPAMAKPEVTQTPVAKTTGDTVPTPADLVCPRCGHEQAYSSACGLCKMDLTLHIQRLKRREKVREVRRQRLATAVSR